VNGKPLPSGARFKSTYDFGLVSLDINHAYAEDSGIYMCKATNNKGQAQTSGTLRCTSKYVGFRVLAAIVHDVAAFWDGMSVML
jgi:hypothetical protein